MPTARRKHGRRGNIVPLLMALVTASCVAVATSWLLKPSPLMSIAIPGNGSVKFANPNPNVFSFVSPSNWPHYSRWLVVKHSKLVPVSAGIVSPDRIAEWFFIDSAAKRIVGPWQPFDQPTQPDVVGFIADGRFVAIEFPEADNQFVCRLHYCEPQNFTTQTKSIQWQTNRSARLHRKVLISSDRSTLVFLSAGLANCLTAEIWNVKDATLRRTLHFPHRWGHLHYTHNNVAAISFDLSPGGDMLALGPSWHGSHRRPNSQTEVYDTGSGRLVRSLSDNDFAATRIPDDDEPGRFPLVSNETGVWELSFSPDGHDLLISASRRVRYRVTNGWQDFCPEAYCFDLRANKLIDPDTRCWWLPYWQNERPIVPDSISADGRYVVWRRNTWSDNHQIRITDIDGQLVRDWKTIPLQMNVYEDHFGAHPVPDTNGVARVMPAFEDVDPTVAKFVIPVADWLSIDHQFHPTTSKACWLDFETNEMTTFRSGNLNDELEWGMIAVQPKRVSVVFNNDKSKTRIETWEMPPRLPDPKLEHGIPFAAFVLSFLFFRRRRVSRMKVA